jgi:hypothetical protein
MKKVRLAAMENSEFDEKGCESNRSHPSEVQGIQKDESNDVLSKTFRELPTEIRLSSKLMIIVYFLLGFKNDIEKYFVKTQLEACNSVEWRL